MLDTASGYGESEKVIGDFTRKTGKKFSIITKISVSGDKTKKDLENDFLRSLKTLNTDCVYGCLVHSFEDFEDNPWVWDVLAGLKQRGLVKKTGFSLYRPEELEILFEKDISFDLVQIPFSVFDKRFDGYFNRLKNMENIDTRGPGSRD